MLRTPLLARIQQSLARRRHFFVPEPVLLGEDLPYKPSLARLLALPLRWSFALLRASVNFLGALRSRVVPGDGPDLWDSVLSGATRARHALAASSHALQRVAVCEVD